MRILGKLWADESGVLLSAEAVVVGTVAVVGLTAGLSAVATAVNEELKDVSFAIRSLDQSYEIPAQEGCGARTAGSSFKQQPVEKSLQELCEVFRKTEKEEKAQAERLKQQVQEQKKKEKESSESKEQPRKRKKSDNI